jgi:solute carrier family 30 (zinc transporter), member 1
LIDSCLEHGHDHGNGHSHSHQKTPPAPITTDNTSPPMASSPLGLRRSSSTHSMYGHPAQTRAAIQQAAQEVYEMSIQDQGGDLDQEEQGRDRIVVREPDSTPNVEQITSPDQQMMSDQEGHVRTTLSEGALNMRAVLIHVAGDAMGSIGVIISGLIIWLTHSKHRFYADPALSVGITILIMCSAVPLGMWVSPGSCPSDIT